MNKEIKCELTGGKCIHADAQPDEGIYENCRLCEVYQCEYPTIK
jgi:hypothetical protein